MGGSIGGIVGSVAGGLLQKSAADKMSDAQLEAAMMAYEQFKPYDVDSPIGTVRIKDQKITTALSPQAQGLLDLYAGEGGQGLEAATAERLGILDQLAERGEEDARRFTRERLFSAGQLGTTYGTRQIGEVERAIADARLSRMLSARDMAFQERQGAFSNALAMYQLPNTLAGISVNRNPAATVSAMGMMQSAQTANAPYVGLAQGLGNALGQVNWDGVADSIGNIFGGGGGGGAFSVNTSLASPF